MSLAALLGSATDNSYLSLAEAEALANQSPADLVWKTETDDTKKEQALVSATKWMDTLDYVGSKCDPAQPLKWPRQNAACGDYSYGCSDFPPQVEEATFMVANTLLGDPNYIIGSIPGSGGSGGGGTPGELIPGIPNADLQKLKLDVMEITWKEDACSSSSSGGVLVLEKFPQVGQMLGCLTVSVAVQGDSRLMLRVRS